MRSTKWDAIAETDTEHRREQDHWVRSQPPSARQMYVDQGGNIPEVEVPMQSDWKERFEQAERGFHELKALTKKVPAGEWTPEYRELANLIHTLGREVFYVNPDDFSTGRAAGESKAGGGVKES